MSEDRLLQTLAKHARQNRQNDDADASWEALAAGELSDDERQRLIDQDPDGERKAAAFDPLGREFRDAVARNIKASLADAGALNTAPKWGKRPSRWLGALAASLVAAVAFTTLLRGPGSADPLPGYSSTMRGGSVTRSVNDTQAVFTKGDRVELILTPDTSISEPLNVVAYRQISGSLAPVAMPEPQWSEFGAARVVATIGQDLALPEGDSVLLVAVARAGALPSAADVLDRSEHGNGGGGEHAWQLVRFELRVTPP